ncbi:MAG: 30S ribosomal protein S6 [Phycisphaerae bacterium]
MNQYEAMFLFDPTFGGSFENCEAEIRRLMERAEGRIILCRKWDERRLAYRIKGRKRGVYVLTYFEAPPEKITPLERDAKLSEDILRVLVVRAEGVTREAMEQAFVAATESSDEGGESRGGGRWSAPRGEVKAKEKPVAAPAGDVKDVGGDGGTATATAVE